MRLRFGLLRDPFHFVAFGFGSGLTPYAPGTAGSLLALLPAWALFGLPMPWRVVAVAVAIAVGIWVCGVSARRLGVHDHGGIVFDEIAGILATALAAPSPAPFWLALAFVLFRFFDIWKPWPIRQLDHSVGGGAGIMIDDLMAAVYAAACLTVVRILLT
ncbi:MAG TPA: phosphatidylglycerophosphatase A [Gammaproteobacteria bacterium]|nr:phosphatidylglycerophosphatase A [Gammaproteobacteria bacterium]